MKKLLFLSLISAFLFIGNITIANAHCGTCGGAGEKTHAKVEAKIQKPCVKKLGEKASCPKCLKAGIPCKCKVNKKPCAKKLGKKPCEKKLKEKKPCTRKLQAQKRARIFFNE